MARPERKAALPGGRKRASRPEGPLDGYLRAARREIDAALDGLVPEPEGFGGRLFAAMRHSLFSGGKRLRPCLCLLVGESLGQERWRLLSPACALEMVHTYSLIHDDLPAMDDDDLRRGKPTCHRAFDEATAILAGDGLLTHAFLVLATDAASSRDGKVGLSPASLAEMVGVLSRAAGPLGMVLGQMRDILAEGSPPDRDRVRAVHETKTGAMIEASFEMGAIASGTGEEVRRRMAETGRHVGLAFQIVDDILDVTATTAQMGKRTGKDSAEGKATYPAVFGLDRARDEAARETRAALGLLPEDGSFFLIRELVEKMLARSH